MYASKGREGMGQTYRSKPSIQLEGYPILTEISESVYEDLVNSSSKYLVADETNRIISIKKSFFKKNKQVPNVTRYIAKLNEDGVFIDSPRRHSSLQSSQFEDDLMVSSKMKTIAIILESPHVDEYTSVNDKLIPIAPAQGQIGKKIETNLEKLILYLSSQFVIKENDLYRIVIINAIPFQTSLHYIHQKLMDNSYRELRDKVWMKMWGEISSIKSDFNEMIGTLKKDSILINACPKSIKPFIHQELVDFKHKYFLFESNHPSSTEPWVKSLFQLTVPTLIG